LVITVSTIYLLVQSEPNTVEWLGLLVVFGCAAAAIEGAVIGFVIYKVTDYRQAKTSAAARIAIGAGCLLIYGVLIALNRDQPFHPTFEIGSSFAVGGLAGLMSRAKNSLAPSDPHGIEHDASLDETSDC
jgi:hypothetical protein